MSGYSVNWSECSTVLVYRRSLDSEIFVKLKVMNTERQFWKIAFNRIDNALFSKYIVTARPEHQYRYKANVFGLQIVDMDSSTTIVSRKTAYIYLKVFKVVLDDCIKDNKCYQVTLTFEAKFGQKKSLESSMKSMQYRATLTDYAIKTKEEEIPCHKLVLAARSDYFRTMFTTPLKAQKDEKVLDWENVFDVATVRDLLHYIYHGSKPPNIGNTCLTLLEASHLCLLDHLKDLCVEAIVSDLTLDNVLDVLVVAEKVDCLKLKDVAIDFIVDHENEYEREPSKIPGCNNMEVATSKNLLYSLIKEVGNGKKPV